MSGTYPVETNNASIQMLNRNWVDMISSQGHQKQAAIDESSLYIREFVRAEAASRIILPPQGVTNDELDRDDSTDEPRIIVEKEPYSEATYMELQGTPETRYFYGLRYSVYFGKIASQAWSKSKFQLMTYRNDIRKILADNGVKDIADQEDFRFRKMCNDIVGLNPSQRSFSPTFSSSGFKIAFQAMYNRRRPIGKMLLTQSLFVEAIDLPAMAVGNAIAERHYDKGIEGETRLFGVPVVSTLKSDIYDPRECWIFAPQNFLGNSFLLQDATLYIEQKAEMISFYIYEAIGSGIGNVKSMQQLLFGPANT